MDGSCLGDREESVCSGSIEAWEEWFCLEALVRRLDPHGGCLPCRVLPGWPIDRPGRHRLRATSHTEQSGAGAGDAEDADARPSDPGRRHPHPFGRNHDWLPSGYLHGQTGRRVLAHRSGSRRDHGGAHGGEPAHRRQLLQPARRLGTRDPMRSPLAPRAKGVARRRRRSRLPKSAPNSALLPGSGNAAARSGAVNAGTSFVHLGEGYLRFSNAASVAATSSDSEPNAAASTRTAGGSVPRLRGMAEFPPVGW